MPSEARMAKVSDSFLQRQERSNDWRSRRKQEKAENSKKFRNYYRVFDRVPADGPLLMKPAALLLFYTGADSVPAPFVNLLLGRILGRTQTICSQRRAALAVASLMMACDGLPSHDFIGRLFGRSPCIWSRLFRRFFVSARSRARRQRCRASSRKCRMGGGGNQASGSGSA
jgi:hypothetical protein